MDEANPSRRRLKRPVPYKKDEAGAYSTHDAMHQVRKAGSRKWDLGVRQPYNIDGQYDFKSTPQRFSRLRDAQEHIEAEEAVLPRRKKMQTEYHDRRGL